MHKILSSNSHFPISWILPNPPPRVPQCWPLCGSTLQRFCFVTWMLCERLHDDKLVSEANQLDIVNGCTNGSLDLRYPMSELFRELSSLGFISRKNGRNIVSRPKETSSVAPPCGCANVIDLLHHQIYFGKSVGSPSPASIRLWDWSEERYSYYTKKGWSLNEIAKALFAPCMCH